MQLKPGLLSVLTAAALILLAGVLGGQPIRWIVTERLEGLPTHQSIGISVEGKSIDSWQFGDSTRIKILILGGIHGDEPESVDFTSSLWWALESITADSLNCLIRMVDCANLDGYLAKSRRNARGIDLNRNFPTLDFVVGDSLSRYYGGREPLSEPETQAIVKLIEDFRPDLIVALHAPLNCVNFDGPAEAEAARLAELLNLPLVIDLGYATRGSLGGYYGRERNQKVITLEFPSGKDAWQMFGPGFLRWLEEIGDLKEAGSEEMGAR